MKQTSFFLAAAALVVLSSAFTLLLPPNDWKVKGTEYSIKFDDKSGNSGIIQNLKGTIHFDEANLPASAMDVTVDVATINTGNAMKNSHAKAKDMFDAKQFPTIHFKSAKIEKLNPGYQVIGELTMKGVTKPVTIPFTFVKKGTTEATFKGNFEVKLADFNMNKSGIGKTVKLELVVPVQQ